MLFAATSAAGNAGNKDEQGVPTAVAVQQPPLAEVMQEPYHEATPEILKFYQVSQSIGLGWDWLGWVSGRAEPEATGYDGWLVGLDRIDRLDGSPPLTYHVPTYPIDRHPPNPHTFRWRWARA